MIDGVVAVCLADLVRMEEFKRYFHEDQGRPLAAKIDEDKFTYFKQQGKRVLKVGDEYFSIYAIPSSEVVDRFLARHCNTKPSSTRLVRDPDNYDNTLLWQHTLDFEQVGGNKQKVKCQRWVAYLKGVPTWTDVMKAVGTMKK